MSTQPEPAGDWPTARGPDMGLGRQRGANEFAKEIEVTSISRAKLSVAFALTLAFGAITASTASAESWFVNGTKLTPDVTLALATTAAVDESAFLEVPSLKIKLTCTGGPGKILTATGPYIQAEASLGAESLTFEGCSEIEPATCKVQSSIKTEPVVGSLETGSGALDRIRFAPKNGRVFTNFTFEGSCSLAGEKPISGQVVIDATDGQTESVSQPIEGLGRTENNSLEIAKAKAYIDGGRALLTLASGSLWSFH
jgi:hypothetical protein